jgi:hypothetical protein
MFFFLLLQENCRMQSGRTPEKCVLFPLFWKSISRSFVRYVLGIRETLAALVVWRVQKSAFLRRSRFVSCVRTQVHVTVCLFVRICLYVTCTKKNLGNSEYERVCAHTKTRQIALGLFWAHRWMEMTLPHIEYGLRVQKITLPSVQKNTLLCTSLPLSNKQEGVIGVFGKPSIQFQWFSHCLFVMNRERETRR